MSCRLINRACEEVFPTLADESIDLIIADPPYKDYQSNRPLKKRSFPKIESLEFDTEMFAMESFRVLKQGSHLYCFCDHKSMVGVRQRLSKAGFICKDTLTWVKNNHGCGDLQGGWGPQTEFILYCTKGRGKPLNRPRRPNVFHYPKVDPKRFGHGTVKPVELLTVLIEKSSKDGDIVLDPYAGTGSTGVAAMQAGRSSILVEKDVSCFKALEKRVLKVTDEILNI